MLIFLCLIGDYDALMASSDISVYEKLRDKMFSMISDLGFEAIKPQGAFYIFPDISTNLIIIYITLE